MADASAASAERNFTSTSRLLRIGATVRCTANVSMAFDCNAVSSPPAGSMASAGADVNRPATSPAAPAITRPALKALSCFAGLNSG